MFDKVFIYSHENFAFQNKLVSMKHCKTKCKVITPGEHTVDADYIAAAATTRGETSIVN